ncbi:MAG: hypothetical protein CL678_00460 [Bdellovibrionaceae bacterium]|nr:hypothetical protein [Pseudobdellovibrionaceae bacterium]|tara:strand:+ start:1872 stop:2471 length:600 start_codon:yes stop_codon:yes gene_type:complete
MTSAMPLVPSALRTGNGMFNSRKRNWVDDSVMSQPPSGDWQTTLPAPTNVFAGGVTGGDAVYNPLDRNYSSASAPVVTGVKCRSDSALRLNAGDLITLDGSSPFYSNVSKYDDSTKSGVVAVVASDHTVVSNEATAISVVCCGPVKLRYADIRNFANFGTGVKRPDIIPPGTFFCIYDKYFLTLTCGTESAHIVRCQMF